MHNFHTKDRRWLPRSLLPSKIDIVFQSSTRLRCRSFSFDILYRRSFPSDVLFSSEIPLMPSAPLFLMIPPTYTKFPMIPRPQIDEALATNVTQAPRESPKTRELFNEDFEFESEEQVLEEDEYDLDGVQIMEVCGEY
ncbi:unnamed protein product [Lactuca saligna]|uniref:Uncharacterized protein n=1 Tax=Lactuca saligna TaxID=75948 RepID=A0AA35ZCT8_LACSI|nr:unnamed protein product [Lactuca saligna]